MNSRISEVMHFFLDDEVIFLYFNKGESIWVEKPKINTGKMSMQHNETNAPMTENIAEELPPNMPESAAEAPNVSEGNQDSAKTIAESAEKPEFSPSTGDGASIEAGGNAAESGEAIPAEASGLSTETGPPLEAGSPLEAGPLLEAGHKKIAELEAQSENLAAQLAEAGDQLLRKAADFENFRKRMNQEKQSAIEFANQSLLLDIIPIMDDFERAIQSAQASEEITALPAGKAMLDGITMIENRLASQLENKWGLKRFNSAGEAFDPNRHEAMFMEKSPDVTEATVQEDFVKGYTLKDRVIRAAKVKVLVPEE